MALGAGQRDPVELVTARFTTPPSQIPCAIVNGAEILDEVKASDGEVTRHLRGVEPKGPRLGRPPECAEERSRSLERLGVVQHAPVYIGEDHLASPRRGSKPAEGPIDCRRRQVVRNAFPNEKGAASRIIAAACHEF